MVLDPIPQSLPVHFLGSRPQPPTSRRMCVAHVCDSCVWFMCMVHVYGSCIRSCGVVCVWLVCMAHVYGSFVLLTGVVSYDALSLQVILRKRALYLVALLRKMTCNLRHPMSLRHPVLNGVSRVFSHPGVVLCGFSHPGGVLCGFSHLCECGSFANALCVHW